MRAGTHRERGTEGGEGGRLDGRWLEMAFLGILLCIRQLAVDGREFGQWTT